MINMAGLTGNKIINPQENTQQNTNITNSGASQTISQVYNLLKESQSVIWKGPNLTIKAPSGLTQITQINFRSFEGDLLPYTSLTLPSLKIKLIPYLHNIGTQNKLIMKGISNTSDVYPYQEYRSQEDTTQQNQSQQNITEFIKGWSYNKSYESQLEYNLSEIVDYLNTIISDWFGGYSYTYYTNEYTEFNYVLNPTISEYTRSSNNIQRIIAYVNNNIVRFPYVEGQTLSYQVYDCSSYGIQLSNTYTVSYATHMIFQYTNSSLSFIYGPSFESCKTFTVESKSSNTSYKFRVFMRCHQYVKSDDISSVIYIAKDADKQNTIYIFNTYSPSDLHTIHLDNASDNAILLASSCVTLPSTPYTFHYLCCIGFVDDYSSMLTLKIYLITIKGTTTTIKNTYTFPNCLSSDEFQQLNFGDLTGGFEMLTPVRELHQSSTASIQHYFVWDDGSFCISSLTGKNNQTLKIRHNISYYGEIGTNNTPVHFINMEVIDRKNKDNIRIGAIDPTTWNSYIKSKTGIVEMSYGHCTKQSIIDFYGTTETINHTLTSTGITVIQQGPRWYNVKQISQFNHFDIYLKDIVTGIIKYPKYTRNDKSTFNGTFFSLKNDTIYFPTVVFDSDMFVSFIPVITTDPKYFNITYEIPSEIPDISSISTSFINTSSHVSFSGINDNILEKIELLILLQYEYNDLMFMCTNFPNSDNIVFTVNDRARISFKTVNINATGIDLECYLVDSNGEPVELDTIKAIYGKLVVNIDWVS